MQFPCTFAKKTSTTSTQTGFILHQPPGKHGHLLHLILTSINSFFFFFFSVHTSPCPLFVMYVPRGCTDHAVQSLSGCVATSKTFAPSELSSVKWFTLPHNSWPRNRRHCVEKAIFSNGGTPLRVESSSLASSCSWWYRQWNLEYHQWIR